MQTISGEAVTINVFPMYGCAVVDGEYAMFEYWRERTPNGTRMSKSVDSGMRWPATKKGEAAAMAELRRRNVEVMNALRGGAR